MIREFIKTNKMKIITKDELLFFDNEQLESLFLGKRIRILKKDDTEFEIIVRGFNKSLPHGIYCEFVHGEYRIDFNNIKEIEILS